MQTLGENKLWSFADDRHNAIPIKRATTITSSLGHVVESYIELAKKVAELQFRNPSYVLLFRGQPKDYKNQSRNSTLKPTIFRAERADGPPPSSEILEGRYAKLREAETRIVEKYARTGAREENRLRRQRILRWSILQHYEICHTPLLDVTHSLRIAASFASLGADEEAYIFIVAVPNISGMITASGDAGLQIIRLASICPPQALRPHLQDGYLLGEYPDLADYIQKSHYRHHEVDFGRRLIAKFRFNPQTFWKEDAFQIVPRTDLYPDSSDPFFELATEIKQTTDETES